MNEFMIYNNALDQYDKCFYTHGFWCCKSVELTVFINGSEYCIVLTRMSTYKNCKWLLYIDDTSTVCEIKCSENHRLENYKSLKHVGFSPKMAKLFADFIDKCAGALQYEMYSEKYRN